MPDVVYYEAPIRRSRLLGEACMRGFRRLGISAKMEHEADFREPDAKVALHYGLSGRIPVIRNSYWFAGRHAILLDLGYWDRRLSDRYDGYHRFAFDGLHSQPRPWMPADRFSRHRVRCRSMDRGGSHVLLCGQSAKAAAVYDLEPEEWERRAIDVLQTVTDRPIWYMPKGSWPGKRPLPGTVYKDEALEPLLEDAWAVVTHHSNSAVHALAAGVPVVCEDGAAKLMSGQIDDVETPTRWGDETVEDFLRGVAYLQWTPEEMARGEFWRHIMERWL